MKNLGKPVFMVCGRIKQEFNANQEPLLRPAAKKEKISPAELKRIWENSDALPPLAVNREIRKLTADSSTGDEEILMPVLGTNK